MSTETISPEVLKAPFIYFGGKRRVANRIWRSLGDVDNYVEPFAGSLAVLLGRPRWHQGRVETVNDIDGMIVNVWRAMQHAPDEVAKWADFPVNETELFSRHLWLVNSGRERITQLETDPDFYDPRVAGYWLYGINAWIGRDWCSGRGPWHLGDPGRGVNRQRPHLGDPGQGVNRKLPDLAKGRSRAASGLCNEALYDYFALLAARLRRVRVCAGDWSRVVTSGALAHGETVGVFLDPPYSGEVRYKDLYAHDDHNVAVAVREWAIANGDDPRLRIVLAGYRQEHDAAMPTNWRRYFYSAWKAYGTSSATGTGKGNDSNRHNEALWFSPNCQEGQRSLFDPTSEETGKPGMEMA